MKLSPKEFIDFIVQHFDDTELHTLILVNFPRFHDERYSRQHAKIDIVLDLVSWCRRHNQTDKLLEILQTERGDLFKHFGGESNKNKNEGDNLRIQTGDHQGDLEKCRTNKQSLKIRKSWRLPDQKLREPYGCTIRVLVNSGQIFVSSENLQSTEVSLFSIHALEMDGEPKQQWCEKAVDIAPELVFWPAKKSILLNPSFHLPRDNSGLMTFSIESSDLMVVFPSKCDLARPSVIGERVIVTTSAKKILLLDYQKSCEIVWTTQIPSWWHRQSSLIYKDQVYVPVGKFGVYQLSLLDGAINKKFQTNTSLGQVKDLPAIENSNLFVGTHLGYVVAYEIHNANMLWQTKVGRSLTTAPIIKGELLVVGAKAEKSTSYEIVALRRLSGEVVWRFTLNQPLAHFFSSLIIFKGLIICWSDSGTVYALEPETGNVVWFYQLAKLSRSNPVVINDDFLVLVDREGCITVLET